MPDCKDCRYCFCECGEDIVCGHPESYKVTSFGLSVNACRARTGPCGPAARLFEIRTGLRELGKETGRPDRAWHDNYYIDVKDQRVLGEVCVDRISEYSISGKVTLCRALAYPEGLSCLYLGKFTSIDRAKRAVEESDPEKERLINVWTRAGNFVLTCHSLKQALQWIERQVEPHNYYTKEVPK